MCGARLLAQLICRSADRNILAHGQTFTSLHAHCVQYPRRWFALVLSIKEATHEPRAGQHCTLPNLNYGARFRPKACQARAPPRPGPRFTPRRGCHSSCHLAHGSNDSAVRRWSAMHHGDYIGCRRCPLRMRTCACPMCDDGVWCPQSGSRPRSVFSGAVSPCSVFLGGGAGRGGRGTTFLPIIIQFRTFCYPPYSEMHTYTYCVHTMCIRHHRQCPMYSRVFRGAPKYIHMY